MERMNETSASKLFRDVLLYGGITKYEYNEIRFKISSSNRLLVAIVSGSAAFLIMLLYALSKHSIGLGMNQAIYETGILISVTVFMLSIASKQKHHLIMALVHASYLFYYSFGILVGTIIDPEGKTVLFMALLVFLPTLFTAPPIQTLSITGISVFVFLYMCFAHKTGTLLEKEVFNVLFFSLLGSISGTVITCMKIQTFLSTEKLKEVSRKDHLTGMDNRNAYELDKHIIPDQAKENLSCVYIDVNGLKTINDKIGHAAGDKMLTKISEIIQNYFGEDFAYRLGGDEFVVFIPDISKRTLIECLDNLKKDVEKENYHVAIGYAQHDIKTLPTLKKLQGQAESMMYEDKTEFYKNSKFERRHH